jgi:hypothetical protein
MHSWTSLLSSLVVVIGFTFSAPSLGAYDTVRGAAPSTLVAAASTEKAPSSKPPAAPSTKDAAPESGDTGTQSPDEEESGLWSFIYMVNDWYPIVLDPHLEPEVDDKVVLLWVMTVLFGAMCGPLWIPMLIVGENPGMEYFVKEALITIVVDWLTYAVGGVTTSVGGLGSIIITANLCYLAPVSLINTYDRALKRQRAKAANGIDADSGESESAVEPLDQTSARPRGLAPQSFVGMAF